MLVLLFDARCEGGASIVRESMGVPTREIFINPLTVHHLELKIHFLSNLNKPHMYLLIFSAQENVHKK